MVLRVIHTSPVARRDWWRVLVTVLIGAVVPITSVIVAFAGIWGDWHGGDILLAFFECLIAAFWVFITWKLMLDSSADLNASLWCLAGLFTGSAACMTYVILKPGSAAINVAIVLANSLAA